MRLSLTWVSAAVVMGGLGAAAIGQSAPATETSHRSSTEEPALPAAPDKWSFEITPYFWLGALDGDVTARGVTASIDQDFGDVIDLLKDHLNFGASIHFEARYERWSIFIDALYMDLEGSRDGPLPGTGVDVELQQFIGEIGGSFRLAGAGREGVGRLRFVMDVLVAARVYYLDMEVDPQMLPSVGREETWFDPIIGLRGEVRPLPWLGLFARGDIGGFGIGEGVTSEFSWNILTGIQLGSQRLSFVAGYRWLDVDFEDGGFEYDMLTHGPFLGMTMRF